MRRIIAVVSVLLIAVLGGSVRADVFASGIHFTNPDSSKFDGSVSDGSGLRINFLLNDTATSVVVKVRNASTNAEIFSTSLLNQSRGWKNVLWSGVGAPTGTVSCYVEVTASNRPYSSSVYTVIRYVDTAVLGQSIFTRGVDVVRSQTSSNFGYMYASNAGGGPLPQGVLRYTPTAEQAGTNPGNPILLPSRSTANGGTIPWSADPAAPVHATTDYLGRVYVSDYPRGEVWRMDNNDSPPKRVVGGIQQPRGLAAVGEGSNFKMYIAAGNSVLRANLGLADTLAALPDTIAKLGMNVRDVILDDRSFLYVNLRNGSDFDGTTGGATERYDISGSLPVTRNQVLWSLPWTGYPIGLGHWSGADKTGLDDDIIYISHRSGATTDRDGIYSVTGVDGFFQDVQLIFKPTDVAPFGGLGTTVNVRADLAVDPVGNIVFFENGNEYIVILSPPSSAQSVSYTTKSATTFPLGVTSVERLDGGEIPVDFLLLQNYPNPFNPTTTIEFIAPVSGSVRLAVYNILGQEVSLLLDEFVQAGHYNVVFDARNFSSGPYFYALKAGDKFLKNKMVLLK